ncbi:PREDICTED: helix-loop-helix protein delilah-like [Nicrophorus vespilloides]|uniref:Helix-loop-helix protein delilah-like n=1 Tax=Nicrophorus vespilloides TaxID=110193 RepID=A0ABM1NDN2_NICVS|nr:PREDICTED: helix-loop-helix protein delilah-like [Nicrophorus vespilloides]
MDSLLQYGGDLISNHPLTEMAYTDPNNNDEFETNIASPSKEDKYSLRPRSVRRVTEVATKPESAPVQKVKNHKPKQKPAPLSKYRRKTANARERNRMREINQAFETLRRVIPQMASTQAAAATAANEKLTKITTLRLAMKYISSLSAALNDPGNVSGFIESAFSDCSDLDCLLLESDGESLPLSDHSSLLASPDFPEPSLSPVDFGDPSTLPNFLHSDFSDHGLEQSDFSDFLLT